MRARNIKPGFWENELLGQSSHSDRLLFIGLWCLADRDGKLEDRPSKIRHLLFGYDRRPVDVEKSLCNLMSLHLITRYYISGQKFISIPGFKKHQTPHPHEAKSKIPDPPKTVDTVQCRDMSLHVTECQADILNPDILNPDVTRGQRATQNKARPKDALEVEAYAQSIGFKVNGQHFIDTYEKGGWVYGKSRLPVKDWKACVRTWKSYETENGHKKVEVVG